MTNPNFKMTSIDGLQFWENYGGNSGRSSLMNTRTLTPHITDYSRGCGGGDRAMLMTPRDLKGTGTRRFALSET
jgi:hypothetical protein